MDYIKYRFDYNGDSDILLAFLTQFPFETFEEKEFGIEAYLPTSQNLTKLDQSLDELKSTLSFTFQKETIKSQNWNAFWESNFQTIRVGNFCGIRADFHSPFEDVDYEIIINPKMAFGTGHHATTYMVIEAMQNIDCEGFKVLDYGCGTGVLAILASMKGAEKIDAVDIDEASFENTVDNCHTNAIENVQTYQGTLDVVKDKGYDLILANINRNVILDSFSELASKLKLNGKLIISGIISSDEELLLKTAYENNFKKLKKVERNNWLCIILERF